MRGRRMNDLGGGPFGGNAFDDGAEDVNPNAFMSNLSDCMLVLACGLMVALVVAWSIKLPNASEIETTGQMEEVTDLEDITGQTGDGSGYTDLGRVYQDPKTGKMYMIKEVDDSEDSGSDSDSSGSGSSGSAAGSGGMSTSQTGTADVEKAGSEGSK